MSDVLIQCPNTTFSKDNVSKKKTVPRYTDKKKTMNIQQRWKLSVEQFENLEWLKSEGVNTDDATLAHWVKTYSFERIYDVLNHAKSKNPDSLGAYMQKLFKTDAIVENNTIKANTFFARDYAKQHSWHQLKILGKYCVFEHNGTNIEIPLHLKSEDFINKLIEKHEMYSKY